MNIKQIIANFSKKASSYEANATMQRDIAQKLISFLPDRDFKCILDIGCGTGFLTRLIAERYPNARILGIDIAPAMIDQAAQLLKDVEFRCCSVYELRDFPQEFDLVVTSSALHWMSDLQECFSIVNALLLPGGAFVSASFVDESLFELKDSFRVAYEKSGIKKKKHVIDFPDSQDILNGLADIFDVMVKEKTVFFLYYPSAKLSIQAIKDVGGNYSYFYNQSFTERKTIFSNLFKYYDSRFQETERSVIQSWEVLFVNAKKPDH